MYFYSNVTKQFKRRSKKEWNKAHSVKEIRSTFPFQEIDLFKRISFISLSQIFNIVIYLTHTMSVGSCNYMRFTCNFIIQLKRKYRKYTAFKYRFFMYTIDK